MTRKALIKSAELKRMANIAQKFGVVIEQQIEGVTARAAHRHGSAAEPNLGINSWNEAIDTPPEPVQPLLRLPL